MNFFGYSREIWIDMELPDTTLEVDFGESVWLIDPLIVVCLVECNI